LKICNIYSIHSSHGHPVVRRQNAVATRVVLATASNGHVPRGAGHEITDAKYGPGIVVEALLSVVACGGVDI